MNYSDKPTYPGQKRELKPEGKELLAKTKKLLARVVLPLIITATAFGASQTEGGKTFLGIAAEVKSGEVIPEGETTPDLITIKNGGSFDVHFNLDNFKQDSESLYVRRFIGDTKTQEIVNYALGIDEVLVIKKGASLRDEPIVGDIDQNDIVTEFATANNDIILSHIHNYCIIYDTTNTSKDRFIGIYVSSLPKELQDEMNHDKINLDPDVVQMIWIKTDEKDSEIAIETKIDASNINTVDSLAA